MTSPINGSLLRAKQFVPQYSGVAPDAEVAQAHALIAIGEVLTQILAELQAQRQTQITARRRASRSVTMTGE